MKTKDIFCASQASTTIMDSGNHHQPSSSAASGGRTIDRHNPIIRDEKRLTKTLLTPPLFTTTSLNNKTKPEKHKTKPDTKRKNIAFADENNDQTNKNVVRKQGTSALLGWNCTKPSDFISPATSSRFLLGDKSLVSDQLFDPLLKQLSTLLPPPPPQLLPEKIDKCDGDKTYYKKKDEEILSSSPVKTLPRTSSSLSSRSSDHQVVVLRVSLHCKGCERKMRKHLSKMEGVTSFNIDFIAKKVTVVGDITPLAVLTSISKVKNAKLLTPTTISSSNVPQVDPNFSEIKKQLGLVA
ncbi:protein SODIUM POTASSIUM ROOT DEFECTIVE 2-like [Rutidosis leptorrhynchoides]|uniref:protein SODIUM POTASSIUM ROOT DEFECTIVE 2-like n=1 Tax=Rutidosis leptorrhynchoides TaxID=125765 RepID=UPI003A99AD99